LNQKRNLKKIVKVLTPIAGVKAVVLYGSFARGDFGPKSDLDLFIITDRPATRREILEKIADLDLDRRIQPTVRTELELKRTDSGLLSNIFEEGKVIYLREPMDIPAKTIVDLNPHSIFTFELTALDQKNKAKFNREMYERASGKYKYKGLLGQLGGERLSSGCVVIPMSGRARLLKAFNKYKITYKELKVWK
jgi:predicted nucleotidyltransferase